MKEKVSQEGVDRIINELSHKKARYNRLTKIGSFKDSEAWPSLKELLQEFVDTHQRLITALVENGDHLGDTERIRSIEINKTQRDVYSWFIQLIEKPDEEAKKLKKNISDIELELKSKRDELKSFGEES